MATAAAHPTQGTSGKAGTQYQQPVPRVSSTAWQGAAHLQQVKDVPARQLVVDGRGGHQRHRARARGAVVDVGHGHELHDPSRVLLRVGEAAGGHEDGVRDGAGGAVRARVLRGERLVVLQVLGPNRVGALGAERGGPGGGGDGTMRCTRQAGTGVARLRRGGWGHTGAAVAHGRRRRSSHVPAAGGVGPPHVVPSVAPAATPNPQTPEWTTGRGGKSSMWHGAGCNNTSTPGRTVTAPCSSVLVLKPIGAMISTVVLLSKQ